MSLLPNRARWWSAACGLIFLLGGSSQTVGETLRYDLQADGPGSSSVEEIVSGASDYVFPITGFLEVILDPDAPRLANIDSDILLAPAFFEAISPRLWHNLDLLAGEYVTPDSPGETSMVFRPREGVDLRAWEVRVDLTQGKGSLALTGGIEQIAASPLEPSVRFDVHGTLVQPDESTSVPEPAAGLLLLLPMATVAARRRR